MRLGGRVGDETFYTAQTFCEADEADGSQHAEGGLMAVGIEGEHSACAAGLPVVDLFVFEAGESRIEHLRDLRMVGKPLGEGLGIFLRSFHAKCQCLDAAGDEPAVPWREAAADGLVEETDLFRDLFVPAYDKACKGVIVSGEVLGAAVKDDIGTEVDRIAEVRAHEGIVRDEERAVRVCEVCHRTDVRHLHHRVRRRLDVDGFDAVVQRSLCFGNIRCVDEAEMETVLLIDEAEETDGAAVKVIGGKDRISRFEKLHDHRNRSHAGRVAGTVTPVLEQCDHLLRAFPRRVLHAGVVVARGLSELRMPEGRGLKYRNRNAAGRIFPVAAMNADRFYIHRGFSFL